MDHSTTEKEAASPQQHSPLPSHHHHHHQAIQNRHRALQRLVFQMQHHDDTSYSSDNNDGLLHSKITVRGDASHLSAISDGSRTEYSAKSPLSVLQEGDDSSFFSRRSGNSSGNSSSPASSSRRNSLGSERGRYQEVKDDFEDNHAASSSSSRRSVEPEGEYQPQISSKRGGGYENAMRARKEAVDRYSSVARKKASLMTNHNFDKEKDRSGGASMASSRQEKPVRKSPPPPPFSVQSEHTFLDKSIVAPDDGSSVSSMTSMDSYMKQQYILRELERLRERESRARPSRSSPSRARSSSRRHEDSRHAGRRSSYDDNRGARPRHERDQSRRTPPNKPRSRSMPRDRNTNRRGSDLESIWEQDSKANNSRSTSSKSRHSYEGSKSSNKSLHKSQTCAQSHSTSHTPPLSQIEECCIKHPHILLSDQSDVNIWTCMRYCKDETTGRWVTKKKVCEACLQEDEESAQHHYHHNRHPDKSDYNFDERTHSMSSNSEDEISNQHNKNTVNVYTDDGNQTPLEREAEAQRRRFIRRLAARAYHFPGNTWCEDWTQYIANTHIVFGIFFHHPLHPVTSRERLIILLGSVAVGLLMSNLIYLWFLHENFGMNDVILHIDPGLDVTKLMICLWTLGSFVHTIFDLSVWHIKACTLCRYGGEVSDTAVKCGRRSGITIVLLTLAFATYLCLVRASRDARASMVASEEGYEMMDDYPEESFFSPITLAGSRKSFYFLFGYIIEFVLAVFIYGPIMLTVVFTGILGCNGRIPVLGGRPREMAKEQRYAMKRQRYIMPRTLKLGDEEFEADMWGDEELMTKF